MPLKVLVSCLAAAAVLAGGVSIASGQSPSPAATETAMPTEPPTTTPTPASTSTQIPVYDGRPCESGTLWYDFVVLGDGEPVPSCVQPFSADGSAVLYGLSPVPAGLRLRGISERTTQEGVRIVSVVYETVGGPPSLGPPAGRALVTISLQTEALSKPHPVHVQNKGTASSGDFLPTPGLVLEPAAASQIGSWFGPSGLYRMDVDQSVPGVPLDIRELAPLLTPLDTSEPQPAPTPLPPTTGTGTEGNGSPGAAWFGAACLVTAVSAALAIASRRRRASVADS